MANARHEAVAALVDRLGLGYIDLGQIKSGETTQIHIAVIGHVQRHAVDIDGHLARIKTAQIDHFLVAVVARQIHAGEIAHRVGHRVGVDLLHLGAANTLHVTCAKLLIIALGADFHRTQGKGLAGLFSHSWRGLSPGSPHGRNSQSAPEPGAAKSKTGRVNLRGCELQWHGG